MEQQVLVTGGTGTLGRAVVRRLEADGRAVRVLSRRPPPEQPATGPGATERVSGDIATGRGISDAVAGIGTIVHCATDVRHARRDVPGVRNFFDAARRAGVGHLVYISIVGIDRVPLGYYQVKLAEERMVQESGMDWSILRATQFHDLIRLVFSTLSRLPVLPVLAGTSFQPVDVRDVAARLAELVAGPPAGRAADLGGPRVRAFTELARAYRRAAGVRKPVVPVPLPGKVGRAYRAGGHLAPGHADGTRTFEEHLAEWHPGASVQP